MEGRRKREISGEDPADQRYHLAQFPQEQPGRGFALRPENSIAPQASKIPQHFGAMVAEWLDCSPPTKANRVKSPAGSFPDFRKRESCRTLVSEFSRGSPVSPASAFHPNLSTDFDFKIPWPALAMSNLKFSVRQFSQANQPDPSAQNTNYSIVSHYSWSLCRSSCVESASLSPRRAWFGFRISARGYHAGRCRWSAGFLGVLPFSPSLRSDRSSSPTSLHPHRISEPRYDVVGRRVFSGISCFLPPLHSNAAQPPTRFILTGSQDLVTRPVKLITVEEKLVAAMAPHIWSYCPSPTLKISIQGHVAAYIAQLSWPRRFLALQVELSGRWGRRRGNSRSDFPKTSDISRTRAARVPVDLSRHASIIHRDPFVTLPALLQLPAMALEHFASHALGEGQA
ncbi:hypothetical protein PR048_032772 [Dryococelus australis]|uniref:Uncharacterized protein n=1 Tax=Dryococelus australis TaxID=614101 RepID=A0ABQ9G363_9NEOP|nr:hypothetical protein PR048_032772 [Dryococelus australis]